MKSSTENMQKYSIEPLRIAILRRAVRDYMWALRWNRLRTKSELERFFRSDYGQILSGNKGEYIIEKCKQIVNNYKK